MFDGRGWKDKAASVVRDVRCAILIFESELMSLCRNALQHPREETGGQTFGGYTGSGMPVITLVTPPGPDAEYGSATFVQDSRYLQECRELLLTKHGSDHNGRYHSHQQMHLYQPSGGDVSTANSQMRKRQFPAFVEIITNHQSGGGRVVVNPYLYFPDRMPRVFAASLSLLPGLSPLREAAFGSVVFPTLESYEWRLPMERIDVRYSGDAEGSGYGAARDQWDWQGQAGPTESLAPEHDVPAEIRRQIRDLPERVRTQVKVVCDGGNVAVELPWGDGRKALVGFVADELDRPSVVQIRDSASGQPRDVTKATNPFRTRQSLPDLWRELQGGSGLPCRRRSSSIDLTEGGGTEHHEAVAGDGADGHGARDGGPVARSSDESVPGGPTSRTRTVKKGAGKRSRRSRSRASGGGKTARPTKGETTSESRRGSGNKASAGYGANDEESYDGK